MAEPVTVPRFVVNVHGVGPCPQGITDDERAWWITTDEFESVLDGVAAGAGAVGLTFDDGFVSDVEIALPRLVDRGLRATFFPCAGWLDRPGRVDADGVRELLAAGMGLGTHGWCHRDWRMLAPAEAEEEFHRSAEVLAEVGGSPIEEAAIPFGRYDRRVLQGLRRAGYRRVHTSDGGLVDPGSWRSPRTSARPWASAAWVSQSRSRAHRPVIRARTGLAAVVKGLRGSPRG